MILIYLLTIASAWQRAVAGSDGCSRSVIISNQNDANKLINCDTFDGSITISSSASGVITINNVEEIKGAFSAEGASELTQIITPDLDSVKGGISLSNLNSLTTITMGALSQVSSDMIITGNPSLKRLGFQELEEVKGQLVLKGSFHSVSLPSLDQVEGQTTITGSSSLSCNTLNSLKSNDVFKNGYTCVSGSSALSPGAKGGVAAGVIVAVLLIVMVVWFVLRWRRQKQRAGGTQSTIPPSSTPSAVGTHDEKSSMSQSTISPKAEPSALSEPQTLLPRKPVGSAIFLDSRSIYEAPNGTADHECYELDAGPIFGSHQRPINAG